MLCIHIQRRRFSHRGLASSHPAALSLTYLKHAGDVAAAASPSPSPRRRRRRRLSPDSLQPRRAIATDCGSTAETGSLSPSAGSLHSQRLSDGQRDWMAASHFPHHLKGKAERRRRPRAIPSISLLFFPHLASHEPAPPPPSALHHHYHHHNSGCPPWSPARLLVAP